MRRNHVEVALRHPGVKLLVNAPTPRSLRRFETEVAALLRVAHPGVVKLQATGVHAGRPYLVMDLIEGATLQAQLDREGALPWREAADRCFSPSNAEAILQLPRFAAECD